MVIVMENNNKIGIGSIIVLLFISLSVIFFSAGFVENSEPVIVYTVYLDGNTIGNIKSKKSFEYFINEKEEELKNKYNVNKYYIWQYYK